MSGISDMTLIKNESISAQGLTFYPITMEHYETWQKYKGVLTLRMATLPALYAVKPYLSALYAIDVDTFEKTGQSAGLTGRLATILCLALRLPIESSSRLVKFTCPKDKQNELTELLINTGDSQTRISPAKFGETRKILAEQNGEELPDNAENPELIEAQKDMAAAKAPKLIYDLKSAIASVAYKSNVRETDLTGWTIREFEARKAAIDRDLRFTICGIVEGSGASWKNGNPVPSWCYDRKPDFAASFTSEDAMISKLGKVAKTV